MRKNTDTRLLARIQVIAGVEMVRSNSRPTTRQAMKGRDIAYWVCANRLCTKGRRCGIDLVLHEMGDAYIKESAEASAGRG